MKSLNKLYWLKQEIEQIQGEIKELTMLGGSSLNGMPSGNKVSSPVERFIERKERLIERLQAKLDEFVKERERTEDFIETIDDIEVRMIARKRFIEHKGWQVIGDEMYMDRNTASRKIKRYMERRK